MVGAIPQSIEYKVAAMEAELRGGEVSLNGVTLYVGDGEYADAIVPFDHRTPEGREWFYAQLKLSVDKSHSRAIELAIEAEAERRWKESGG